MNEKTGIESHFEDGDGDESDEGKQIDRRRCDPGYLLEIRSQALISLGEMGSQKLKFEVLDLLYFLHFEERIARNEYSSLFEALPQRRTDG